MEQELTKAYFNDKVESFYVEYQKRAAHYNVKSHYHPYYEIFYLISGKCTILINHSIYHMSSGDFVIIKPSEIHRTVYDTSESAERIAVFFNDSYLSPFFPEETDSFSSLFPASMFRLLPEAKLTFEQTLRQMLIEQTKKDIYAKPLLSGQLLLLLSIIGRCPRQCYTLHPLEGTEQAIEDSAQFIYEHFSEPLTLYDAANIAHMSPTYFSKKFKLITGFGFKEYLNHIRIQEASLLLRTTSLPITTIALECGFTDGNYFGDAFRKEKGISPRSFRQMHLPNN